MFRKLCLFLVIFSVGLTGKAYSQYYYGGWAGQYHHASTAAEGYSRGIADVVRSQGMANMMNAQALGAVEDARSKYIDNRLRATQAYYEQKRIRDQYNEEQQSKTRYYLAKKASSLAPMTKEELDPNTGKIMWPRLLDQPQYAKDRQVFDEIFARRAAQGVASNEDYIAATNRSKEWRQRLTQERDDHNFNELRDAILFIRRLVDDLSL